MFSSVNAEAPRGLAIRPDASQKSSFPLWLLGIVGALVLLVVGAVVFLVIYRQRRKAARRPPRTTSYQYACVNRVSLHV